MRDKSSQCNAGPVQLLQNPFFITHYPFFITITHFYCHKGKAVVALGFHLCLFGNGTLFHPFLLIFSVCSFKSSSPLIWSNLLFLSFINCISHRILRETTLLLYISDSSMTSLHLKLAVACYNLFADCSM